jgi:ATP-dependent exoDNAse (exonuclease V) beta subunit
MTAPPPLADQAARDRIRDDLGTTFVVEAAAGTGKTSALVERMVAAVAAGAASLDRVVAVTFTDAAAGELKLRLRTAIEQARADAGRSAKEHERLRTAVLQLEAARIGTIHSFCAELLRERPVEARVDPQFQVGTDFATGAIFERVFDRWFEQQLAAPGPGVRRILRRPPGRDEGPRQRLRGAARELLKWRDFPAPWTQAALDRDREIDVIMDELASLGAQGRPEEFTPYLERSFHEIHRFVEEVARRERDAPRDYDGLEADLAALDRQRHWTWRGRVKASETERIARRDRRDALKRRLEDFVVACGADIAPHLRDDLWPVVEEYERLKARAGYLDFLDLLLRARDLVRDVAAVRHELQRRFTHVFVDEFQDTDPLQAELLLLLAADDADESDWRSARPVPGKLFLVGDPKQSIYRFRRADVQLYEDVKRHLVGAGAEVLHLTVSFRAVPSLQAFVNAGFAPRMTGASSSQAAYVPLQPHRPEPASRPTIVALPVPEPYGDYGTIVHWRVEASAPVAVAAFVEWLLTASGWTVTERERPTTPVAVQPQHVCLLFRRMQSWGEDKTRPYVRALEARGLRHVLVGGSSFHAREEIAAVRTALLAVERPDDELALFATLRGPLFALDDATLLAYRHEYRTLHPFRALPAELPVHFSDVSEALGILRDLHRHRNRRPLAGTIARLLGATRAHAGLAIWPTGEQALANVNRLVDMARRSDRQGVTSFRAFVERLERDAEEGETGEAPLLEDGAEGVRIMTVHKAKGLEFPVVILADPTAKATPARPGRHVDVSRGLCAQRLIDCTPPDLLQHEAAEAAREVEESDRVLYVATTRARDLLVVPTIADQRLEGWTHVLNDVVYPAAGAAAVSESDEPPGCPVLRGDGVLVRPRRTPRPAASVVPGLHRPPGGGPSVVWWAPSALRLAVEENLGLRQQKLLQTDESGRRSTAGIEAHAAWQRVRDDVRERAARPALVVQTATERAAAEGPVPETPIDVEQTEIAPGRPHGPRFGTLVHAVLAAVDLDGGPEAATRLAALEGRLLGASAEEIEAAGHAVTAALAHPLVRRAAAGACRREMPVAIRLGDASLVEGVVDAAFEDADGWTVVDFKTDAELSGRLPEYRRQVDLYVRAVAEATGRPCRGVLLRV